jgi:predicted N-acyltransferase
MILSQNYLYGAYMKNFDALIVHSTADIDPMVWEVPGLAQPFSSHSWFAFCEKVMPESRPVHILLFRAGKTVARGSFWLMEKDVLPIDSLLGRHAASWIMKHRPLMVCRSPVANMSGLVIPAVERREALSTLIKTAEEYAEQAGVSFIVYDYLNRQEIHAGGLPYHYSSMEVTEPGTALEIRWNSFEEFLASLSKQGWKDYRRHSNQAARIGIRISAHAEVTDHSEALELIRRVEKRHGSMPNPWTETILTNISLGLRTWLEARQNERLVGCGLLLRDGEHMVATLMGLDYDTRYAYFPFVYTAIQKAIEQRVRVFHAGSGAYELKMRLGFSLEQNNYIAFAGTGKLFSAAVRLLGNNRHKDERVIEGRLQC